MKRSSTAWTSAALAAGALLVVHAGSAYLLDELELAERLFAADLASALTALLALAVVSSRVLLAFVLPGVVVAAAAAWWWTPRAR